MPLRRRYVTAAATGALAGTVATLVMSLVMVAARKARLTPQLPPARIAEDAVEATTDTLPSPADTKRLATAAHFGFGAAMGAVFGAIHAALGWRPISAGTALGLAFGNVLYLFSYQGWIPALGILPPASRDHPGRVGTMVLSHWAYGAVLGSVTVLLGRRRR